MTTLRSYGEVPSSRQAEMIRNLHNASEPDMDAVVALKALERSPAGKRADLLLIWTPANQTKITAEIAMSRPANLANSAGIKMPARRSVSEMLVFVRQAGDALLPSMGI
jgi:hypothetical protein